MKRINKCDLNALLEIIGSDYTVYGPRDRDGIFVLEPWAGGDLPADYLNLDVSPRSVLMPRTETILEYDGGFENPSIAAHQPTERVAVLGIRPCDARGLDLVSRVVESGDFADENVLQRRANTLLIGIACTSPGPNCLCAVLGLGPSDARGTDLFMYPVEEHYYLEITSAAGEAALAPAAGLLEDVSGSDEERVVSEAGAEAAAAGSGVAEAITAEMFDHPYWENLASGCLSCGICGYVCPTCHCYALFDVGRNYRGMRMRGWDSCQFENYLLMAGGHNPRPTPRERVRQRFMHKLSYFPKEHGELMCTGCGRCADKCPAGINMLRVLQDLEEVL